MSTNDTYLHLFCVAGRHEPCDSWQEHRIKLDKDSALIRKLIEAIPDTIAAGKASQSAAAARQGTLLGSAPTLPPEVKEYKSGPPVDVKWNWYTNDFEEFWVTDDQNIRPQERRQYYKEDARKVSILTYKPRLVRVWFSETIDEWSKGI